MIDPEIRQEIMRRIHAAEAEHNVRVLYAIESGSRAWGFASPNSDYDVRFVYARPQDWYLSIDVENKRDVIEYPIVDEIDINGWDIRKALQLFRKSNPSLVEWLYSPITYVDDGRFASTLRDWIADMYSVEQGIYHYRSMAKSNFRGYLQEDLVPLKKYLYVLRPLLSARWIEEHKTPAPIEFDRIKTLIAHDSSLLAAINDLLALKKQAQEKQLGPKIPEIHHFIERELTRLEFVDVVSSNRNYDPEILNAFFREVVTAN